MIPPIPPFISTGLSGDLGLLLPLPGGGGDDEREVEDLWEKIKEDKDGNSSGGRTGEILFRWREMSQYELE